MNKNVKPIRVIIADDMEIVRTGIEAALEGAVDIEVCGQAANGKKLVEAVERLKPDIVLTDIQMPVLGGVEATREIKNRFPYVSVIGLSVYHDGVLIATLIAAGATGYLAKTARKTEILAAIRSVYIGVPYYCSTSTKVVAKLVQQQKARKIPLVNSLGFSEREMHIIKSVCNLKNSKEIAEEMVLSVRTVEFYRKRIMCKMKVSDRGGLIMYAMKNGIV